MDTIGDLQSTYSIASIVFCGGSLEPLGGQNILEAAVWGKPVLYGPSMDDFLDAKALLDKTGGGIQVKDGRELAERALYYLTHPAEADAVGRLAKEAVMLNKGAAGKHADVIYRLLYPNLP
jgi:3-deoxy-D-manno-octulosonic-acid transferase